MNSSKLYGALFCLALSFSVACESNDLGKNCGTQAGDLPLEPIAGENPVNEVARLQRDGTCESFQCLTYRGYEPYCTRSCSYKPAPKGAKECIDDKECGKQHCYQGKCQDDDCPAGFECREIQNAGPLTAHLFCAKKEGCKDNSDCESLGNMECNAKVCFDQCLLAELNTCAPTLICRNVDDPVVKGACSCNEGELACSCHFSNGTPWPDEATEQRGVCEPQGSKAASTQP